VVIMQGRGRNCGDGGACGVRYAASAALVGASPASMARVCCQAGAERLIPNREQAAGGGRGQAPPLRRLLCDDKSALSLTTSLLQGGRQPQNRLYCRMNSANSGTVAK
jgi:hypothetical protein